ncbi:hypothetical protein NPIL_441021 [Nephila pilipes]|uniref:Uncharacterized protein n=1 Tax=Nephila pilipes TaxID=299642 RepID=A0A8X6TVD0_NEPPI|nr:hypothetical protein NPIL_441021 [Nephila pilipes]
MVWPLLWKALNIQKRDYNSSCNVPGNTGSPSLDRELEDQARINTRSVLAENFGSGDHFFAFDIVSLPNGTFTLYAPHCSSVVGSIDGFTAKCKILHSPPQDPFFVGVKRAFATTTKKVLLQLMLQKKKQKRTAKIYGFRIFLDRGIMLGFHWLSAQLEPSVSGEFELEWNSTHCLCVLSAAKAQRRAQHNSEANRYWEDTITLNNCILARHHNTKQLYFGRLLTLPTLLHVVSGFFT